MEAQSPSSAARPRRRLLLAVLVLCLALLGACGQEGDDEERPDASLEVSRDPVLLPADARNIIDEVHRGSDEANATLDESIQASVETSPALDIDDAFFKRLRALGRTSIGSPGDVQDAITYVPRQTSYPARFLAFVNTDLPDDPAIPSTNWLWLYEKQAADEPWKLAFYVTLPDDFPAPDIPVDEDGFAQTVSRAEAEDLKLAPSQLPEELAEYLSTYEEGTEESVFAEGAHTSRLAQGLKTQAERETTPEIQASVEVEAGEFPVQAFRTADGGALVLFTEHLAHRYVAIPGKSLKPLRGSEGLLEEGDYATIQRNVINMVAAVVPPAASEGMVEVVGTTGGTVSFETT